ncbi:unnamed protein product [Paramecium pentaurelia]|uniref:Uncharacterized protein n=1 Tax=Paramecium pentaurelia TaxID=43138 RepID=A0A8S1YI08_9CILI|nr:unnamed protein product [Paramecium pentaurelia]
MKDIYGLEQRCYSINIKEIQYVNKLLNQLKFLENMKEKEPKKEMLLQFYKAFQQRFQPCQFINKIYENGS